MSKSEVADHEDCSTRTVDRRVANGTLPPSAEMFSAETVPAEQ
jgi:hypothetical protein